MFGEYVGQGASVRADVGRDRAELRAFLPKTGTDVLTKTFQQCTARVPVRLSLVWLGCGWGWRAKARQGGGSAVGRGEVRLSGALLGQGLLANGHRPLPPRQTRASCGGILQG